MMRPESSNASPSSKPNVSTRSQIDDENNNSTISITSKEITSQSLDICNNIIVENDSKLHIHGIEKPISNMSQSVSIKTVSRPINQPITNQPFFIYSNLPSPTSLNIPTTSQPQTLFLQALAKLNESSLSLAMAKNELNTPLSLGLQSMREIPNITIRSPELTPPDSLTSAPPSYSFVLRQMGARRPRLMVTFIPSPSFVQHTPPPNYATAFDIYVDNAVPPPPPRVHNFGFTPMPILCPECGFTGMTVVASKITLSTHLCAIILCLLCCWVCAPLPYVLRSCKDVYHYCRNCRNFLGMYCPTNPENTYNT